MCQHQTSTKFRLFFGLFLFPPPTCPSLLFTKTDDTSRQLSKDRLIFHSLPCLLHIIHIIHVYPTHHSQIGHPGSTYIQFRSLP
ncbi:hypothetical protein B0H65DRAFT_465634 [Neurospora tetraspora]|uniref:Secreted protein n=1 Tax=Neurospora tetraspora TaxID=94610 RepID=A0AAE0JEY9_9PEZI|nr:hypothetical protein B0H65DRAFT_465634 [Neurospora tetraspora]